MNGLAMRTLERFHRGLAGGSCCDLAGVLGGLLPEKERTELARHDVRRRIFPVTTVFWYFLSQVLNPGQPCRETVRRAQAERRRRGRADISPRTGAYCQARLRLPVDLLSRMWQHMATFLAARARPDMLWMGMRVGVTDGTMIGMPDTPSNQKVWPQSASQKPGCGFPIMKLVAVFALATGAVHAVVTGSKHNAEHTLLQSLWPCLKASFDLLLGDRNFGSFGNFCTLSRLGLHGVFRLHQGRRMDWRSGKRLGPHDRLVVWKRPLKMPPSERERLPETLILRVLQFQVQIPGFRTQTVALATDLIDPVRFPPEALATLYLMRWRVELFFAHIKTTMHMDILRCRTPEMIERELHMHLIAYNAIRALMAQAASRATVPLDRISFKGACDTLRQYAPHLAASGRQPPVYRRILRSMLNALAEDIVPLRRPRSEPRAVKRRPKNYHRLTKPRHQMGNLPHRNYAHAHP